MIIIDHPVIRPHVRNGIHTNHFVIQMNGKNGLVMSFYLYVFEYVYNPSDLNNRITCKEQRFRLATLQWRHNRRDGV